MATHPTRSARLLWRTLATLGIAVLVASCGAQGQTTPVVRSAGSGTSQQIVDRDDMVAEYEKAMHAYPLPPHYSYPSGSGIGEAGSSYEVGWGTLQVVDFWNCAWGKEWLEYRSSDRRRSTKAFAVYASVVNTDTFRSAWDRASIQEPFTDGVAAAQLGDPSALQQIISVNCADVRKDA